MAAALLFLMTALMTVVLVATMRKDGSVDQKQEVVQRMIVTRSYLRSRWKGARFEDAGSTWVRYRVARALDTNLGRIARVGSSEMTEFDDSQLWELALQQGQLVERDLYGPDQGHMLWNLGADSSFTIERGEQPLVWLRFKGRSNPNDPLSPPFEDSFSLFLVNFPR